MTRAEILDEAKNIVTGFRETAYGKAEDNFKLIAKLWEAYLNGSNCSVGDCCIDAEDVANMMILLKVARNATGRGKDDNYIDIAGYAACGGELLGGSDDRAQ